MTEPVVVLVGGVGEVFNDDKLGLGMVDLANTGVELVVSDEGGVDGLMVGQYRRRHCPSHPFRWPEGSGERCRDSGRVVG